MMQENLVINTPLINSKSPIISGNGGEYRYFVGYVSFKDGIWGFGNAEIRQSDPLESVEHIRRAAVSIQANYEFDAVIIISVFPFNEGR